MHRVLLVFMLFALPLMAETPWYEDYQKGLEALDRGQDNTALTYLQAAIRKHPQSSESVKTYGMNFVRYFPYFNMGKAYYDLERYQEAIDAWAQEESHGAIIGDPALYRTMTDLRHRAFEKLSPPPPAATPAPAPFSTAGSGTTSAYEKPAPTLLHATPRTTSEIGRPPETMVSPPVAPSAAEVQKRLEAAIRAFNKGSLQAAKEKYRSVLAVDPANQAAIDALKRIDEIEKSQAMEKAPLQELLRQGIQDFFTGEYQEAAEKLDALIRRDSSNALGRFFLGCSYAATYFVSGDRDQEALKRAEEEFKLLAEKSPTFVPQSTYISPRIMEVYARIRSK